MPGLLHAGRETRQAEEEEPGQELPGNEVVLAHGGLRVCRADGEDPGHAHPRFRRGSAYAVVSKVVSNCQTHQPQQPEEIAKDGTGIDGNARPHGLGVAVVAQVLEGARALFGEPAAAPRQSQDKGV